MNAFFHIRMYYFFLYLISSFAGNKKLCNGLNSGCKGKHSYLTDKKFLAFFPEREAFSTPV